MASIPTPQIAAREAAKIARAEEQIAGINRAFSLDQDGSRAVEAWFLGPKAENADLLEQLVVEAVRDQAFWRRNYHPSDPGHVSESIKRDPEYLEAVDKLKGGFRALLAELKKSVPFFSMRYQGHMNWDLTLPGIAGYFAAMLYNPNNVAFEGSTATTLLEILTGDDLCQMLGYKIPSEEQITAGAIRPWGHITCDGTVANIEAIWSARNLKYYLAALQAALRAEPSLQGARDLKIRLLDGSEKRLVDIEDVWVLLNIPAATVLDAPRRMTEEYSIPRETITTALADYTLQNLGVHEFHRRFLSGMEHSPVFFTPGSKHYSFPKAASLLGLGAANMIDVYVDLDTRMDAQQLKTRLEECAAERRPVLTVVCVIGSTEESSIDPLTRVLEVREEMRKEGLDFTIHADAAWGGYHASLIRDDFDMPGPDSLEVAAPPPAVSLSKYVTAQFEALGEADSITVDPHKSGYIPYPAGALCYQNSAMRDLVTFAAPVVFHGDAEPTVGIYGVEGSKPGAAAASVYLSHRVIRPTRSGYGKIIGQALFSCRLLYTRLLTMAGDSDPFRIIPVPRLPAERDGGNVAAQLQFLKERIDRRPLEELTADTEAMKLINEIGPDENILAYAFNCKMPSGEWNTSLETANRFNSVMYDRLSIDPGDDIYGYDLIVSTTDLAETNYGSTFIEDYKRRLGAGGSAGSTITVLRSVIMDPWVTETSAGSFIDVLESEFCKAALATLQEMNFDQ